MSFGIPVRNGVGLGLRLSTALSSGARGLRPAMFLNFVSSNTLDSRITFTRASTATFVGSNGLIQSAAINSPRFDYDPVTLAAKGLLIEEQRVNLLTYSEQFDNAIWIKSAVTVTANTDTAPDGTLTADKIIPAVASVAFKELQQNVTISASTSYTFSCYVKAAGYQYIQIIGSGAVFGTFNVNYDLSNGTETAFVAGTSTITARSITAAGNGWYRVSVTALSLSAASGRMTINVIPAATSTRGVIWASDGTSGILQWGAQLEAGAFATSYIPTVASQVTRSADIAQMTGTNFSSWYNQSEGTFVASALDQNTAPSGAGGYFAAGDSTLAFGSAETIYATRSRLVGAASFGTIIDGGVNQANLGNIVIPNGVSNVALAYKLNNANMAANGAVGTDDTSCTMPTPTSLSIGSLASGWNGAGAYINGHIRQIAYYNTRLPNATLQVLTV